MNIIIDPMTMSPHLKYLIPNNVYFTYIGDIFKHIWSGGETRQNILNNYNIDIELENTKIKDAPYFENMFFVINILSSGKTHQGPSFQLWIDLYKNTYNKFIDKIKGKIVIIDNHGGDYEPSIYLNKFNFKCDVILKRVYSNRNKPRYIKNTHSYPFVMDTSNDPLYKLYKLQQFIEEIYVNNKIFFAGSLFEYDEEWDNDNTYEHANRKLIVNGFTNKYPNILELKSVPYPIFHKTISTYKYALDIRGTSRLNKRLYEILSTNTLLLAEKIDIAWPFEDGEGFSEECFFEQGNYDDLYRIYTNFENNPELYKKCLENQMYIVKKYFNNEWLWAYIQDIIN